jgi:hypothetical protein
MGRAFSMDGEKRNACGAILKKSETKRPLGII